MVGGDSNTASEKYCRRKCVYNVISLALFFPSGAPRNSANFRSFQVSFSWLGKEGGEDLRNFHGFFSCVVVFLKFFFNSFVVVFLFPFHLGFLVVVVLYSE